MWKQIAVLLLTISLWNCADSEREKNKEVVSIQKIETIPISYNKTFPTDLDGDTLQDEITLISRDSTFITFQKVLIRKNGTSFDTINAYNSFEKSRIYFRQKDKNLLQSLDSSIYIYQFNKEKYIFLMGPGDDGGTILDVCVLKIEQEKLLTLYHKEYNDGQYSRGLCDLDKDGKIELILSSFSELGPPQGNYKPDFNFDSFRYHLSSYRPFNCFEIGDSLIYDLNCSRLYNLKHYTWADPSIDKDSLAVFNPHGGNKIYLMKEVDGELVRVDEFGKAVNQ
ncbi:MAG: hypothetical protein RL204_1373 [Bacteroidota bacterium]|jgi:hypothetical protein